MNYDSTFLMGINVRQQEYLNEAEHERLVRQAKESHNRSLDTMSSMKKVLGYSLVKLGEKLAPQWDEEL